MSTIREHLSMIQRRLPILIGMSMLLLLANCAAISRVVAPEQYIALVRGERQLGTFTQGRESLTYEYITEGKRITLEGEVYPSQGINFLKVRLLFLNQQGSIISGQYVYHSPYRAYKWGRTSFQKNISIPQGTENISFDFYVEYRVRR